MRLGRESYLEKEKEREEKRRGEGGERRTGEGVKGTMWLNGRGVKG